MTGLSLPTDNGPSTRWTACALLVLGLHAGCIALLMRRHVDPAPDPAPPQAIMLDLVAAPALPDTAAIPPAEPASAPLAPPIAPAPVEAPSPPLAQTVTQEPPATPDLPQPLTAELLPPEPASPALLPTPIVEAPPPPRRATPTPRATPPARTRHAATPAPLSPETPTSPTVAAPALTTAQTDGRPQLARAPSNPQATAEWRSLLVARLQAAKRYPDRARARGDQGVALTTFTLDRTGHVLVAALVRSSGSALLDEEAVALIHRAEPLPPPPPEIEGASLTLTVPVSFALR